MKDNLRSNQELLRHYLQNFENLIDNLAIVNITVLPVFNVNQGRYFHIE